MNAWSEVPSGGIGIPSPRSLLGGDGYVQRGGRYTTEGDIPEGGIRQGMYQGGGMTIDILKDLH